MKVISNCYLRSVHRTLNKKTLLKDYSRPRQNGIIAIKLNDGDKVMTLLTDGNKEIIIANRNGRQYDSTKPSGQGRVSMGVRAMTLDDDGRIVR